MINHPITVRIENIDTGEVDGIQMNRGIVTVPEGWRISSNEMNRFAGKIFDVTTDIVNPENPFEAVPRVTVTDNSSVGRSSPKRTTKRPTDFIPEPKV